MRRLKQFNGKEYRDCISVLIPLYKSFDLTRIQMSIDSLKQQKRINLEIVVAEQSDKPHFLKQKGISYIFIPEKEGERNAVPGLVRNNAARASSGQYLYNSDGDIVYINPFYFAEILELIKTGKRVALYRPPMRRLPIEDFENFEVIWKKEGLQDSINNLDMSVDFTARVPGSKISMIPFRKKESGQLKTFLYSDTDYKRYSEDISLKGSEPKYSTLAVHAGGTFMEREHFFEVGGFCEQFNAWGCHDADLQWKLKNQFNLIQFPNLPEYEVLHLDHKREYFDKGAWQENRKLQELRRTNGASLSILADLKNE